MKRLFCLMVFAIMSLLSGCSNGNHSPAAASNKDIVFFALNGTPGMIQPGNNINVVMPYGTESSALVATFTTNGASVTVAGVPQTSGVTPNNFTSGSLIYTVLAKDGSTRDYTVTVENAEFDAKNITEFELNGTAGIISGTNISVVMPYGTSVTALVANYITDGANVTINGTVQENSKTPNDFTNPVVYTIHAADGSTRNYTVTVTVASNIAKSITEFSLSGTSGVITGNDIAVTVPYQTDVSDLVATYETDGVSITVDGVTQNNGQTPNNFSSPIIYTVHAANGTTQNYKVTVSIAANSAKAITSFALNGTSGVIEANNNIAVMMPYGTNVTDLVATYDTSGENVTIGEKLQDNKQTSNDFTDSVIYTVHAADGSTQDYKVTVSVAANSAKAITSFALNGTYGVIQPGNNIAVVMPFGTNLTGLVATYNTDGASVTVVGKPQVSGQTSNDFTNQVIYTVHAADGTTQDYKVTVTLANNSAKSMKEFALNGTSGVISGDSIAVWVPFGTNITGLVADFVTDGVSVTVPATGAQTSGLTPNNFSTPVVYTVHAADGTTQNYTVTVTVAPSSAKEITEFSLNGTAGVIIGNTISVEMPYSTPLTSLIATYTTDGVSMTVEATGVQDNGVTPNDFSSGTVIYTVHAADGSLKRYNVNVTVSDGTANSMTYFSINNVVGNIISNSITLTLPYGTSPDELTAMFTADGSVSINGVEQFSEVTSNNFTAPVIYTVTSANGTPQNYTVTVTIAKNSANNMTDFALNGFDGVFEAGNNIAVTLPFGTDLKALVATFTTNGAASVTVAGVEQTSGEPAPDFTGGTLTYVVHAEDGNTQSYHVNVTVAKNSAKDLSNFSLNGTPGTLEAGNNIVITLPYNTAVTALIADFTSDGESVTVAGTLQVSGQTENDFTSGSLVYTVHAFDGSTQDYTVNVSVALNPAKNITSFILGGVIGTLEAGNNITVIMPFGANITSLVADFITDGASVTVPATGVQTTGATANDFTSPVVYTVHAADGTTQNYIIHVSVAPNSANEISSFELEGTSGTIIGDNISVVMPFGTDVTALKATYITDGASVMVTATGIQENGVTPNDFTNPVDYVVTAGNGNTQTYTVTVTVAQNTANDITSFSLNGILGTITGNNITVIMPAGTTDLSELVATYSITGVGVKVNGVTQFSGVTPNNFANVTSTSGSLPYRVYAASGATQNYTVYVSVAP